MKQEIERFGFGGLNLGAIFNEGTDFNFRSVPGWFVYPEWNNPE